MTTEQEKKGYFSSLKKGLSKTKSAFVGGMDKVLFRSGKVDESLIEELEELLITSDLGVKFTLNILDELRKEVKENKIRESQEVKDFLKEKITRMLTGKETVELNGKHPLHTVMVVGVNGSGKTTTIGKLAHRYLDENKKVLLAAGDTFRAAATEQLKIWSERTKSDFVSHKNGADPSAVVFDAMKAAKARAIDVLIIDTAGRLHTNANLMEQLKKLKRVIAKEVEDAPHETLLVMDATTGQNGLAQAKMFHEVLQLSGIVLTKLDSTSKGGIVVQIIDDLGIPVKYIGVGEGIEDLQKFDPVEFAAALFAA